MDVINEQTLAQSHTIHKTRADFSKRMPQDVVHLVQYDSSLPVIKVDLYLNGSSYTLPSTATVYIRWGKKDHTFVYKEVLGKSQDGKSVYVEVDNQMTYYFGNPAPILELKLGDTSAGSSPLNVTIDRNPIQNGDIESHSEYPDLVEAVERAEAAEATAVEAAEQAVAAAQQIGELTSQVNANTNAITGIKDGTNIDSFSDVEGALALKANSADVYTKTEVDNKDAAVLEESKTYCDNSVDDLAWDLPKYDYTTSNDNTKALVKTIPNGTFLTNVNKIYGDSEVSENIMVVSDIAQTTDSDLTFSRTNAILRINGTSNRQWSKDLGLGTYTLPAGTYKLACFNNVVVSGVHSMEIKVNGTTVQWLAFDSVNKVVTITLTETSTLTFGQLGWASGVEFNNFQCSFMLVKGTTAPTEFKQGFSGIHNLELSGLKIESLNLLGLNNATKSGYTINNGEITILNTDDYTVTLANLITLRANTTYTFNRFNSGRLNVRLLDENGEILFTQGWIASTYTYTPTTDTVVKYIRWNSNDTNITIKPMLVYGSTAPTTFEVYKPTINIPIDLSTILYNGNPLFEGNSLKAVGTAKDYITPYVAHKEMGYVDLGSLNYVNVNNGVMQTSDLNEVIKRVSSNSQTANIICHLYTTTNADAVWNKANDYTICVNSGGDVQVYNSTYSDPATFKTAMRGVYLVYELATPIEVDIDFTFLKNIPGYSNGSIIAQNTYNMPVLSEIEFLIKNTKIEKQNALTAGTGITLSTTTNPNDTISVDTNVIATKDYSESLFATDQEIADMLEEVFE